MGRSAWRETTAYERALTEFLGTFADHDEQWAGGLHDEVATRLAGFARPEAGDACLDVGGDAGIVTTALSAAVGPGGSVVSIDIPERWMEVARARAARNTHLMQMSGADVIFRDHTFDVVVLSRSIAYESDAHMIIAEANRTLKVGGRLALFCRRRGLATTAEEAFLGELARFVHAQPVTVPEQFLGYPGLADRREVDAALRAAGFVDVTFGDVVTGGRADNVDAWNLEMMRCWPAARIVIGALAGTKRAHFEASLDAVMSTLGDDAYRFHHAYLLATGVKARDSTLAPSHSNPGS